MSVLTPPVVEIAGLIKQHQGLRPLRIVKLDVHVRDRVVIHGLDAHAAEAFVHLVTGALLPDDGDVRIAGRSTREVSTDTEWLASLDRFGMVSERAVLLDSLSVASNLALPLTLAIDPMSEETRREVDALAAAVGLGGAFLEARVSSLSAADRVRVHLARALALGPQLLLLEHPTSRLESGQARAIGAQLRDLAAARDIGFVAISEDADFAAATGATMLRLDPGTGKFGQGLFRRMFR